MRADTKRRLVVLAVCAIGVSCLYWVPGVARGPEQLGFPGPEGKSTPDLTVTQTAVATMTATTTVPASPVGNQPTAADSTDPAEDQHQWETNQPRSTQRATRTPQDRPRTKPTKRQRPPTSSPEPSASPTPVDRTSPSQVRGVWLVESDSNQLTVSWEEATDDVEVTDYEVYLNGYLIETTEETAVRIDWFNSGTATYYVQVRALDSAGNPGEISEPLAVDRPSPSPRPRPTPTSQPTVTPTPDPTESPSGEPVGGEPDDGTDSPPIDGLQGETAAPPAGAPAANEPNPEQGP